MNALRWHLQDLPARLGLPGLAALALLGALAVAWLAVERPAVERLAALQAERVALQARLREADAPAAPADAAATLAGFEARFPEPQQITAVLARVHALAGRHGIALERGEFKLDAATDDTLERYAMVLPLKAEYRAVRRFVRDLLREQPALALEEVGLRRDDAGSAVVEARLRFVLFVKPRSE